MKLFILHPGIQHAAHLANGANRTGYFEQVMLFTSILFKPHQKVIGILKKRKKPLDQEIKIKNHYGYTLLANVSRVLYNQVIVNPHNQSHNNPIYFWQQVFGYLCLPSIYWNRKNLMVVCFETTGWPVVHFCKKWNIPVIMDFASISHEKAKTLGIHETNYGIALKLKERVLIDYGFYCSQFCRDSFKGLTSARKDFVLYLGAEGREMQESSSKKQEVGSRKSVVRSLWLEEKEMEGDSIEYQVASNKMLDARSNKKEANSQRSAVDIQERVQHGKQIDCIKISFIANLEYRKGLDIFLEGIYAYAYPVFLEVHLIGRIRKEWVEAHMPPIILNQQVKLIYQPAMSQGNLFDYLAQEQFDLNVQTSRFDSFAMVVPETMMQGIANVVSPYVGAGEMIHDGIDGFKMPELNGVSLNRILLRYVNLNQEQRKALKEQVLNGAQHMVWENYYANLGLVFKEILADIA